jgi:hypothetical protein
MQSLKFINLKRKTMKLKNILLGIVTVAAIGTSCKKEDATYAPPTLKPQTIPRTLAL